MPRFEIEYTYEEVSGILLAFGKVGFTTHRPVKTVVDADNFAKAEQAFPSLVSDRIEPKILSMKLQEEAKS